MSPLIHSGQTSPFERRHDLDWLRASVFLLLILYHVGMFFVPWSWHVKNPEQAGASVQIPMYLVAQWRLPLLFLVSGAATHFALRRRTRSEFVRERLRRLLLPLAFGMLVVVPPQVYYQRLTEGAAYEHFLAFLPDAFAGGPYPQGNVSWHHLWFLAYALVFALVALPMFHALRSDRGRVRVRRWSSWFQQPGRIFLLALPVAAGEMALRPSWPSTHSLLGDWANLLTYLTFFVYGHLLYSADGFGAAMERQRRIALVLGIAASCALVFVWREGHVPPSGYSPGYVGWLAGRAFNTCFCLLAILGYSRRYLNMPSSALHHANEAVYPFYILHQTVIVALAYHLMDWDVGIAVKFTVIAAGTVGLTTVLYLLIRLHPVTRVLFGMKTGERAVSVAAQVAEGKITSWAR